MWSSLIFALEFRKRVVRSGERVAAELGTAVRSQHGMGFCHAIKNIFEAVLGRRGYCNVGD